MQANNSQNQLTHRVKSRSSKQTPRQQTMLSTKSLSSKEIANRQLSEVAVHQQNQKPSLGLMSRNGVEESTPIHFKVITMAQGDEKLNQKSHCDQKPQLTIQVNSGKKDGKKNNDRSLELQTPQMIKSKSQCRQRGQDKQKINQAVNKPQQLQNMKKSLSIALLKADEGASIICRLNNEYLRVKKREQQQLPFGVNCYGQGSQQQRAFALINQHSESTNSMSSLGEVSVSSIKQQPLKNNSHYGALKHLANNPTGKQSSLFTRNSDYSAKKLTSLDENVCVNSIRETGTVNQKFQNKQSIDAHKTRFSSRQNYGSVCVKPQSVRNKPLFVSVVDSQANIHSNHQGDAQLSSVEEHDSQYDYDTFKGRSNFMQSCKAAHMRLALSNASSPKFTPKYHLQYGHSSLKNSKNKLLQSDSRRFSHNKDKLSKLKRSSMKSQSKAHIEIKQTSQTSMKHSKASLELQQPPATESNKRHKKSLAALGSTVKPKMITMNQPNTQAGSNTNCTKNTQFIIHRNSAVISPKSLNGSPKTNNEDQQTKIKRQKLSKSREFYGSGAVNQMNLNCSITSKTSQLKQDNQVFSGKRKSHGQIKTYIMSSAAKKRRGSGSEIVNIIYDRDQSQPMEVTKKLRKVASISPKNQQAYVQEEQKESVVEKIVDLLEKRNLIAQKSDLRTKPQVNQILQSLLKSHLKSSGKQMKKSSPRAIQSDRQHQRLSTLQLEETETDPPQKQTKNGVDVSEHERSHSEDSNIYQHQKATNEDCKNARIQKSDNIPSQDDEGKEVLKKNKPTPAFKYPQSKNQSISDSKDEYVQSEEYQNPNLASYHCEMTNPDELYYVNTKSAAAGAASSNVNTPKNIKQGQTATQRTSLSDSSGCPLPLTTRMTKNLSIESRGVPNMAAQSGSGSSYSANNSIRRQSHQNQQSQYQQDQKQMENQYQNQKQYGQVTIGRTRFSSNERSVLNHHQLPEQHQLPKFEERQDSVKVISRPIGLGLGKQDLADSSEHGKGSSSQQRSSSFRQTSRSTMFRKTPSTSLIAAAVSSQRDDKKQGVKKEGQSPQNRREVKLPHDDRYDEKDEFLVAECSENSQEEGEEDNGEGSLIQSIRRHYLSSKMRVSHFRSSLRCYKVQKIVGKGAFGKVALAQHRLTGKPVAIKTIDKSTLQPGQIEKVRGEVALMSTIRHKHIIRLLEVFESKIYMYMVLEYAAGGDLLQLVKRKRALTEREARPIFRQIVYGVAHCHCRSVLHRDIKLDNILLDDKGNVKVCDFGISRTIEDVTQPVLEQCGTPAYIAPEILYEDGYKGFKSDIWGMGVLLYAMVTGTVPFRAQNMRELKHVITSGQFVFPKENPRDLRPISPELVDLIRSTLTVDTKKRISIPEILSHPWLNPSRDRQQMQQGLNFQQLQSLQALQPFGTGASQQINDDSSSRLHQIHVENLFLGHGSLEINHDLETAPNDSRADALTLTQTQLNEITVDHATVYINEKAIARCETYGFPQKLVRQQVQSNVLNHATASYHLLVL